MDILAYSPKVEAYIAAMTSDGFRYFDISQDITSCNISRRMDAASSFTIKLQNKGGKYNGMFSPMDRITIYATGADGNRYQQLSGYITQTDRFTLYAQDFTISGKDTIYQLQELFWDPNLIASQQLLIRSDYYKYQDAGFSGVIQTLMTKVAGWPESRVRVSTEFPQEVIGWAYDMYSAQAADIADAKNMVNEFYSMLNTSGMLTGGMGGSGLDGETLGDTNGGSGVADNEKVEWACKWAIGIANDNSHGYDQGNRTGPDYDCSSLVSTAFMKAGFDVSVTSTHYMRNMFVNAGFTWYTRQEAALSGYNKLKRGDIVLAEQSHVELYIGGGQNVGAHSNERGGILGGQTGDQTGNEISVSGYWDHPWDGILRYEKKN